MAEGILAPSFCFSVGCPVEVGLVTVGLFDGRHPSLVCATSTGQLLVHTPCRSLGTEEEDTEEDAEEGSHEKTETGVRFLNFGQRVTAVRAGRLGFVSDFDVLLVGTPSSVVVYDVERNAEHFYRDIEDGVTACVCGYRGDSAHYLAMLGGNCSVVGLDAYGNEAYWTITGGVVTALALGNVDQGELIVGSDDCDIRVFRGNVIFLQLSEAACIVGLVAAGNTHFVYALADGTVGVYDRLVRVWRSKSRTPVTAITTFDVDGDGVPEVVSGYASGLVEVRRMETGDVVFRTNVGSAVAGLLVVDYLMTGIAELVCVTVDGNVRGFVPTTSSTTTTTSDTVDEEAVRQLHDAKQDLLYELKSYEQLHEGGSGSLLPPPNTEISVSLQPNADSSNMDLVVTTNNETVIRAVIVLGDHVFDGESVFGHPKNPSQRVVVRLLGNHNPAGATLFVKALVSVAKSSVYHVFEVVHKVAKFAMLVPEAGISPAPTSYVACNLAERPERFRAWLASAFHHDAGVSLPVSASFVRRGSVLRITYKEPTQVIIQTEDMELAGVVLQDLCHFLAVDEMESVAEFPREYARLSQLLETVEACTHHQQSMAAEVADHSNAVKDLIVRAEDARLLGDMARMRSFYSQLHGLNRQMAMEHAKRTTNQENLATSLKSLNLMIQLAANLRVGAASARVVAACHAAIKNQAYRTLQDIMRTGHSR